MEEELKHRFIAKKIEDFVNDDIKPFPTILCEMERPYLLELVRKFCLFSEWMIQFTAKNFQPTLNERLDVQKGVIDYGDLYIMVNVN